MGRTTGIEWTDSTLNPFVGCSQVSKGCDHCYATPIAARNARFGVAHYQGLTKTTAQGKVVWTGKVAMAATWKKTLAGFPRAPGQLIFVNSMSDFWHENATTEMRREVLDEIRKYPQHGFQVLTKRPERIAAALKDLEQDLPANFWLGATTEDQARADLRIPFLVKVKARIRFLSVEPLLERVSLKHLLEGVHWVIVGGESGPGARPMHVDWVRQLRDECGEAGVPIFFKQWGVYSNNPIAQEPQKFRTAKQHQELLDPVGKGGCLVDGREHKQLPLTWHNGVSPSNHLLPLA